MKKILLSLFVFILSLGNCQAYYFATDVETQVTKLTAKDIELIVTRVDDTDENEVYPVGTKLYASIFASSPKKHFVRDEYIKIHVSKAVLPNGTSETVDKDIKIRPRVFFSLQNSLAATGGVTGLVLGITIDFLTIALPVVRGGKAVIDSSFAVYNTPRCESKIDQGVKGFVKGALFPLPELIFKGEELPIHDESYLWIQDAKADKKNLTAFLIKRKNIFLTKKKYEEAKSAGDI